jgi:hypothetical protein
MLHSYLNELRLRTNEYAISEESEYLSKKKNSLSLAAHQRAADNLIDAKRKNFVRSESSKTGA